MIFIQIILLWISGMILPSEETLESKIWLVSDESVIEIIGTTNISSFKCESKEYAGKEILTESVATYGNLSFWNGEITLKSENFDCFNSMMTKDFQKTINAEEYPHIRVKFLNLIKESENINQENLRGEVEITLAGVSKKYPITCLFLAKNGKKALLSGERKLHFTEFEIEPPTKFFGTIKVNNILGVNFYLVLEEKQSLTETNGSSDY